MNARRHRGARAAAALLSLEADADQARGGFACMFSTSDEYETALISARRAQGRYGRPRGVRPLSLLVGCMLIMAAMALLLV
jgi:hypothetical protein